jgi:hypothetical protein
MHFHTTLLSQNQPHSMALHLEFLRRTEIGFALFTVKDLKIGRQTSVISITLTQNSREEVLGYITNTNMNAESGVSFVSGYQLLPPPLIVDLSLLDKDKDPHWGRQQEMPLAFFRVATRKVQFHFPRGGQSRPGIVDEWIRLATGEKWTNSALGFAADMFPMLVEGFLHNEEGPPIEAKFWYPTLSLNLDIKKCLPEHGVEWLFSRIITKQIKNGRLDIDIVISDEDGEIVALSHHICLALDTTRNLAQRKSKIGASL